MNQQIRPEKSRFQLVYEHMRDARSSISAAATQLSQLIMDLEKAEDFMRRWQEALVTTIEDNGGEVNIESEIREFVPKVYRRPANDNDEAVSHHSV